MKPSVQILSIPNNPQAISLTPLNSARVCNAAPPPSQIGGNKLSDKSKSGQEFPQQGQSYKREERNGASLAEQKPSYVDVVCNKPPSAKRMELAFIQPQLGEENPIEIPDAVIAEGIRRWRRTIIRFVLGFTPSFAEMERFIRIRWAMWGRITVHRMGRGVYIFQMETVEVRQGVLDVGPWSFSRRPFILCPWTVGMPVDKLDVEQVPVWVRFSNLPPELWTAEALSLLASHLGRPLYADKNTSEQIRMEYDWVCIESKVESKLFDELHVKSANGVIHTQRVIYEWIPFHCSHCG